MTRKHFEAVASIINSKRKQIVDSGPAADGYDLGFDSGSLTALEDVANDLANYFISENPRFDEARFIEACGF